MLLLGALLVPVGGVLIARFFLVPRPIAVPDLYDSSGPFAKSGGFSVPGLLAWATGAAIYFLARPIGSTLPSLATAIAVFLIADRWSRR
jgi:cytosine/uracil/thiamine/allantoin permease